MHVFIVHDCPSKLHLGGGGTTAGSVLFALNIPLQQNRKCNNEDCRSFIPLNEFKEPKLVDLVNWIWSS